MTDQAEQPAPVDAVAQDEPVQAAEGVAAPAETPTQEASQEPQEPAEEPAVDPEPVATVEPEAEDEDEEIDASPEPEPVYDYHQLSNPNALRGVPAGPPPHPRT